MSDFSITQFEGFREEGSELGAEEEEAEEEVEGQITTSSLSNMLDVESMDYRGSREGRDNSGISRDGQVKKNKKQGSGFLSGILSSRRKKGAPHRAPFS